jgi:mannose-6-phosphate isomerase class I
MTIKPYIIVPNLIEQPTWGGQYIAKHKQIKNKAITSKKIGQSYELYEHTNLSLKKSSKTNPTIEMGDSKNPQQAKLYATNDKPLPINQLIKQDPTKVLGSNSIKLFGPSMKTLVKYTQAKGNSYQIHVKKKTGRWLPKPESWYFFKPGLVTLGVKASTDWVQYQSTCFNISQLSLDLSKQVKSKTLSLESARKKLQSFIKANNPEKFVNKLKIKSDQAIDLSSCGIHHSWEENSLITPIGNIVYEVQENVYDNSSTLRSFDKGKIKDDGSVRELQLDDYFKYIDRSKTANNPQSLLVKTINIPSRDGMYSTSKIFRSKSYSMNQINFKGTYQDQTKNSFHHLFVKSGQLTLKTNQVILTLTSAFSVFIPASTGSYELFSTNSAGKPTVVLKTFI